MSDNCDPGRTPGSRGAPEYPPTAGTVTLPAVLARSADPVVAKMRVSALLESLPKVGKVRAAEPMAELGIAPTRRVGGLGERQREALLERFSG